MIQATNWLQKGFHLDLQGERLVKGSALKHFLSPSYHQTQVQKITEFTKQHLNDPQAISFANAYIRRYQKDKSVALLDRAVAPYREQLTYLHSANKKSFEKWRIADQPLEIFRDHPKFAQFLEDSHILGQLKVTRDQLQLIDGKPALLVEGKPVSEQDFYDRFEIACSKNYGCTFVIEKTTRQVYTYLDNGKGLEPHHPFLTEKNPISTLSEEEYTQVWNKACEFIRPEEQNLSPEERAARNQDRPFVLQVVTFNVKKGGTNFSQTLSNPRHCYLRLIVGKDNAELGTHKGQVYEVGYVRGFYPLVPLYSLHGRFETPDPWEYKPVEERFVTNIPISQENAHAFYQFVLKYHRDSINLGVKPGFHLTQHNCAVFCKEACREAGVSLPTEIGFTPAFLRICPTWIRKIGAQIATWAKSSYLWFSQKAHRILPQKVFDVLHWIADKITRLAKRILEGIVALFMVPYRIYLGEFFGDGGRAFQNPKKNFAPPLHNWKNFITLPKVHLPIVIQDWQRKQRSTVIYDNHVKLSIIPS